MLQNGSVILKNLSGWIYLARLCRYRDVKSSSWVRAGFGVMEWPIVIWVYVYNCGFHFLGMFFTVNLARTNGENISPPVQKSAERNDKEKTAMTIIFITGSLDDQAIREWKPWWLQSPGHTTGGGNNFHLLTNRWWKLLSRSAHRTIWRWKPW